MEDKNPSFPKQKFELLKLSKEFQKDVLAFRRNWNIPDQGMLEGGAEHLQWLANISLACQQKEYAKNIDGILQKFDLPEYYTNLLVPHLLYQEDSRVDAHENSKARVWMQEEHGQKRIFIEIFQDTTIKDIRKEWFTVELAQAAIRHSSPLSSREKPSKSFSRDKRIFQLIQAGVKGKDIGGIVQKEFGGKKLSYDEIYKIASRFRRKIDSSVPRTQTSSFDKKLRT